jgi:hypothetical protein
LSVEGRCAAVGRVPARWPKRSCRAPRHRL